MRGLEMLANQVAAGCMHAKFPGLEPGRGQRFLTQETALADWSRVVAENGFHRDAGQFILVGVFVSDTGDASTFRAARGRSDLLK